MTHGHHGCYLEILSFDQTGYHTGILEFKQKMTVREVDIHKIIRITVYDLAEFLQRLPRNHHMYLRIITAKVDLSSGDTMSVQRNDDQLIIHYLKGFTCHHLGILIIRDGEDGLPYDITKSHLRDLDTFFLFDIGKR